MKLGLLARILIATAGVGLLLVVRFVFFVDVVNGVRDSAETQGRATRTIAAAARVGGFVTDLETGRRPAPARRGLTAAAARMRAEAVGTPAAHEADTAAASVRAYLASGAAGSAGGRPRADAIRLQVAGLISAEQRIAADAREQVGAKGHRAILTGIGGLVVTGLLLLLFIAYFVRAAVRPLRRLTESTARVAGGDLEARVPEDSAGQVSELAAAFNAMASSLQRSRGELQQQVSVTQTVLDSTIDGICLTDAAGKIVLANRPLLQFVLDLRLPADGTVQESLLSVADRFTDPDGYRAAIGRITPRLDEPTLNEFEFADSGRSFQGFTTPVLDDDGSLTGRVWTLREVTAERAADRLKDDFIATVSHELRTPLTSIVGFLEMLLEEDAGPLTDEQRRFLEIVMRSSQRLMRQVGDLLFISQLDASGLKLHAEEVDLAGLVRDAVDQSAALARQREIGLTLDAAAPLTLRCDRERIAQVVSNLLSNAIKFTPAGGAVSVRVFSEAGAAVVEVEDSGIGIPDAERDRLFQRFFRSSRATQHAIQGTGLGLAISKAIVQAHGGTIGAEPGTEQGTRFRFELPLAAAPAELAR
jgi:signal transduction histidine kinase/HAMP domain-containing protein